MTIEEVSQQLGLTKDTLRYWEKVGLLPTIHRDDHGYRTYSQGDVEWLAYLQALRNAGMTISALKQFVTLFNAPDQLPAKRKQLLAEQLTKLRQQADQLNTTISQLAYKVDHFDDLTIPFERHHFRD